MNQSNNSQNYSMEPQSSEQVLNQHEFPFLEESQSSQEMIRSQINLIQTRRKIKEDSKEMKQLYQTGFDSGYQPSKPLLEEKQQIINHFNQTSYQQLRKTIPKRKHGMRGKRFARAQNLKNISRHIKSLISNNKDLTVKSIAYLLYQIMGHTEIGQQIIGENYPMIDSSMMVKLNSRYQDERSIDYNLRPVIRNVRRRLYDALNVMVAANVLDKSRNILRLLTFPFILKTSSDKMKAEQLEQNNEQIDSFKRDIFLWNVTVQQSKERITKKRKHIQELNKRIGIIRKLITRNACDRQNKQKTMFLLPLLMVKSVPKMRILLQSNTLTIKSGASISILPDMQMLEIIFKNSHLQSRSDHGISKKSQ